MHSRKMVLLKIGYNHCYLSYSVLYFPYLIIGAAAKSRSNANVESVVSSVLKKITKDYLVVFFLQKIVILLPLQWLI